MRASKHAWAQVNRTLIARSDSSDAVHDLPNEIMIMHVDDSVNPAFLAHSSQLIVAAVRQTLLCPHTLS